MWKWLTDQICWGRPPAFDGGLYLLRKTVERGFNRLKRWRGISSRVDTDFPDDLDETTACTSLRY